MLFAANIAVEQEVVGVAITIALLTVYCIYTLRIYTNTQWCSEAKCRPGPTIKSSPL